MAEMLTGKTLFPGSDRKSRKYSFEDETLLMIDWPCILKSLQFTMSWQDIDQLTRIMLLVGKPSEALLEKMGSDEVREGRVSFADLQSGFLSLF